MILFPVLKCFVWYGGFMVLVFTFRFRSHPHAAAFFLLRIRLYLGGGTVLQEDMVQCKGKALQGLFAVPGLELALPHLDDVPTHAAQLEAFGKVALAVALNLGLPEVGAGLGKDGVAAAFMTMPEAAVHEDDGAVLAEHDVGRAGQAADVDAEAEPPGKQVLAHQDLGLGVTAADAGHALVPLFGCQLVCHAVIGFSMNANLRIFLHLPTPCR